jgi:thiosulfate reductase cytochrome b subunit
VLFGWLRFPDFLVIGKWAQYGLQWHFFGMWIFGLNGLVYLTYGIFTAVSGRNCFRYLQGRFLPPPATRFACV